MLDIKLLGRFEVKVDGEQVELTSRPAKLLLIYLILHQGMAVRRDRLAGLMWPESSEKNARDNLRHALWRLRKTFEDAGADLDSIKADDETIRFDPGKDGCVDVATLDITILPEAGTGELIQSLEVYKDDLLPGFYEDWITRERDRLRAVFEARLGELLDRLQRMGEWAQVIEWSERWIALGGAPEPAYRALMIAHGRLNDLSSVAAVYQRCIKSLGEQLGIGPSRETRDLYDRIMAGQEPIPAKPSPGQPHVERPVRGYELQELLGRGHYGAVYRAIQPGVGRDVAVKIILPQFADDPDFIRRFAVEAQLVARLEHPHIVPLYDYWREPGGAFLVMRWLRGGSLRKALERGSWHLEPAVQLVGQISSALHVAHREGIIHQDIKPANILLDEGGNAYLTDFGVAALVGPLSSWDVSPPELDSNGSRGSLGYLAPESIQGLTATPATDIYSLGVLIYELFTGEHPFPASQDEALLDMHLNEPIPSARQLRPDVPPIVDEVIQRAMAKDPGDRYADVLDLAADLQGSAAIIRQPAPAPVMASEVRNPYKGLRPFQEADASDFYGREVLVERLLSRMREDEAGSRFLALVGPSGSGKSSAIAAGLLPELRRGAIDGSEDWFVAKMLPGSHPLDEMELALLRVAVGHPAGLMDQLRRDERGLVRAARLILPDESSQLLLIIDQFEEVFTLAADAGMRDRLLELLAVAVQAPHSQVRVVISLRADFYDRPLMHRKFGQLMQARTEVLVPMDAEELSQAINEPAQLAGVMIEPQLIAALVGDVAEQPGALPLLQYALTELFERRESGGLTLGAYHEMGGVLGALGRRAEEIYQSLKEEERHATRQLFLRLVTLGEGVEDTRRRALRSELEALQDTIGGEVEQVAASSPITRVLDIFGKYRLLTFDRDPITRSPTVEVAHEALLRKWDRLRAWLDEARDDIRQDRAISRAAEEWDRHDRDESYLLRGARLEQIEAWSEISSLAQTPLVKAFISQSLQRREERRRAEQERQAREARLERTRRALLRGLIGALSIGLAVALGLTYFAFTQRNEAQRSAALALSEADARATAEMDALAQAEARATAQGQAETQRAAAEESAADSQNLALVAGSQAALANHDIDTAIALAWQAVALDPDSGRAQAQLSEAAYAPGTVRMLEGNKDIVSWMDISPDDQRVLAGGDDGSVILWDIETGRLLWRQQPTTEWVQDVAFSPDGQIAAATYDDRIMLWSAEDGRLLEEIESPVYRQNIAFSPDGGEFATVGSEEDSQLVIWDLAAAEVLREFDRGVEIEDLFYTADGSAILIASKAGVLTLVDALTGEVIWQIEAGLGSGGGALRHVALSPDGSSVAAVFSDSGLMIWDFETGDLLGHFRFPDGVFSLAFHPSDGSVLVGGQGAIRTVNPQTGGVSHENTSTRSAILDLVITSDGEHAVSTALDQTVRVLDLRQGQHVKRFGDPGALLYETDLSPDNRKALAGWTSGRVVLWDVETGEEIWRFVDDQPILAVTFSPDGEQVLVGGGYRLAQKVESGHIILLDAETGVEIRRFEGQPYAVFDLEFSPDGRTAASAGNGAIAILWDVETGKEIRRFLHEDYWVDSQWAHESYWDVAFTPDGRQLFTAHANGPIVGWHVDSGEAVGQLVGHAGGAIGLQFSHDGRMLVSGGADSQVIVWDVESGEILRRWSDHSGGVGEVAFSPGERLLMGGGGDGTSSLWSLDQGESIRRYGGFVFSSKFLQDGRNALVGHRDGAVELWRIDRTLEEMQTWIRENRYVRQLTCDEREVYRVEPLCAPQP